jgi:hypothetical protein
MPKLFSGTRPFLGPRVIGSCSQFATVLNRPSVPLASPLQPALALQKADRFPGYYVRNSEPLGLGTRKPVTDNGVRHVDYLRVGHHSTGTRNGSESLSRVRYPEPTRWLTLREVTQVTRVSSCIPQSMPSSWSRKRTCGFREEIEPGAHLGLNTLFRSFGTFQGDAIDSSAQVPLSERRSASSGRTCARSEAIPANSVKLLRVIKPFYRMGRSPMVKFR